MCHWGPDGDLLVFLRRAVRLRLNVQDWQAQLTEIVAPGSEELVADEIDRGLDETRRFGPMAAAVGVMRRVLDANDRAERTACLMVDVVIAKSFGWDRPLPLTALHLTKGNLRDLRDGVGEIQRDADLSVQAALTKSAQSIHRLTADLAARAKILRSVAPKLRAKGSDQAVALFLAEDAVAPAGMLSPHIQGTRTPMTARAARRLCDRLVELGAVKELTLPALRGGAMSTAAAKQQTPTEPDQMDECLFDRELADLPAELHWREWMGRIEAVLFASASPVPREDLAKLVGQGVSVDLLLDDS